MTWRFFWALLLACLCMSAALAGTVKRIVSLAPHTTELIYALDSGDKLVAVSDFSDYPKAAKKLPSVASHQGVNFEHIVRHQPDLIVAWRGGNNPQDLARLESLGFTLYLSSPQTLKDIAKDLQQLGTVLGKANLGEQLAQRYLQQLNQLKQQYATQTPVPVFYYLWQKPMMTVGKNAWATQLISLCGGHNVFDDSPVDYPQVSIEQVIRRKPTRIIALFDISPQALQAFWQPWQQSVSFTTATANTDTLHRFTPRLIIGLTELCKRINSP